MDVSKGGMAATRLQSDDLTDQGTAALTEAVDLMEARAKQARSALRRRGLREVTA